MKILVACEFSGKLSSFFRRRGHSVVSCDLKQGKYSRYHYQGDVKDILHLGFDALFGFPECRYLCLSGVRWLHEDPWRWWHMEQAVDFFYLLWDSGIPKICLENPVHHSYAQLPPYSQIVHPWQFSHGETKATCLWLKGLPKLEPVRVMKARKHVIAELPPGEGRSMQRSVSYTGMMRAMADQWG